MSRFYDALREAGRSNPAGRGGTDPADLESLVSGGLDLPAEPDNPSASGPPDITLETFLEPAGPPSGRHPTDAPDRPVSVAPTSHSASPPPILTSGRGWDLGTEQALLDAVAPRQEGPTATSTTVHLDPKARLIPHVPDRIVVEHYRRLRTKLLQQQTTKAFRTLLITSPGPAEGKTVTVVNLGLSFAMLPSFPVLIVDGDLRKGSLGKWFGVNEQKGLSNLLDGSAELDEVILKCDDFPLHFVVRGTSKSSAGELLNSPALSTNLRRMSERYSLMLVDSPPVNLMTDTQLLAGQCDAVLLIARAFATTQKAFKKAVQDLRPFRVLGTVLNGGTSSTHGRHYRRYYDQHD